MKFGKSIGSQQDGNSELHYVDYKLLKKHIKETVVPLTEMKLSDALSANRGFEEELATEIQKVNACFGQRHQELMLQTEELSEVMTHVDKLENNADTPPESLLRLVNILRDVDQLRKYAVWNAVAVVKILKKRRKQTNFGLEDVAAERAAWLSRQVFFSGSDFAELHAAIESLGHVLVQAELGPGKMPGRCGKSESKGREQCPICLDTISDMVELSCNHRFCWKCFVLGPIAFQPGEYRISQCPICRKETSEQGEQDPNANAPSSEGVISRFLHTYFPQEKSLKSVREEGEGEGEDEDDEREMRDVVGDLVKAIITDAPWGQGAKHASQANSTESGNSSHWIRGSASSSSAIVPSGHGFVGDFFQTLPQQPRPQDKQIASAQKLQWLQLASTGDPLALDGHMYCSLCSEPLLMEAVLTTPCKHHFHRICVSRLDLPKCPLCTADLPFSWFLPSDHPCAEHGFRVVPMNAYDPPFPGAPGRRSCGWPLHRPPAASLHGPGGLIMMSYLHRIVPMGEALAAQEELQEHSFYPASPAHSTEQASSASSSEESGSDDKDGDEMRSKNRRHVAYGRCGKIRLCTRPLPAPPSRPGKEKPPEAGAVAASTAVGSNSSNRILLIGEHLEI